MNTFNKFFHLLFILGFAALLGLTSCEGPEGPQGPAGPTGANGINGVDGANGTNGADGVNGDQGPAGPVGPKGETGNANVLAYTYSVEAADYVTSPSFSTWFEVSLTVPGITSDIVDYGLVHVYLEFPEGYRALPFTFHTSTQSTSMIFFHSVGRVLLRAYATDGNPTKYTGVYKVVVVDGSPGKNTPNLNWNKYEEVAAYYDLED